MYFNGRISTLQYCDGFCPSQYESTIGMLVMTSISDVQDVCSLVVAIIPFFFDL